MLRPSRAERPAKSVLACDCLVLPALLLCLCLQSPVAVRASVVMRRGIARPTGQALAVSMQALRVLQCM